MTLHPALFAAFVVLAASAAGTDDNDWALSYSDGHRECVRTPPRGTAEALCKEAWRAVLDGRLSPRVSPVGCRPAPGCITAREDCIVGYRGTRREGYCR